MKENTNKPIKNELSQPFFCFNNQNSNDLDTKLTTNQSYSYHPKPQMKHNGNHIVNYNL